MIKLRQQEEILVQLDNPKLQAADLNVAQFVVPFACRLKGVLAKLTVAGTTGSMIVDVNKNGTTIFSAAPKITFATTAQEPTYAALTTDPTTFVKNDVISVDVDSVHSTPGEGLSLLVVLQRGKASSAAATTLGGVGPENE